MQHALKFGRDMLWPGVFVAAMIWVVWYFPRFIVTMGGANDNMLSKYQTAGALDYLMALLAVIGLVVSISTARATRGEVEPGNVIDRISLFVGRVTMLLLLGVVGVMFFEVVARYIFEKPTLWANETSLWLAGFIFLLSGIYAMQQRSHISIYLVYDMMPRNMQRACDVISTMLICAFAFFILWGSWTEASQKFMRWETFGTAFDPPIPATTKMLIIVATMLLAVQAVANLISDWSRQAEAHALIDETEVEEMIESAQHQFDQQGRID